jgi:hypothetical protein
MLELRRYRNKWLWVAKFVCVCVCTHTHTHIKASFIRIQTAAAFQSYCFHVHLTVATDNGQVEGFEVFVPPTAGIVA